MLRVAVTRCRDPQHKHNLAFRSTLLYEDGDRCLSPPVAAIDQKGRTPMTYAGTIESPFTSASGRRPFVASYDLGHEYSQQHCVALQCMVEDADDEPSFDRVPHLEEVVS